MRTRRAPAPWGPSDDTARYSASFLRQIVLLAGAIGVLAAVTLVVVVQAVIATTSADAVERVLTDRAETVVAQVAADSPGTTLSTGDDRLDPGVAIYDTTGRLVAGQAPGALAEAFTELGRSTGPAGRTVEDTYRALGYPFATAGGARGVVVVAEPLAPYESAERSALLVSGIAGLFIVALTTGLAAWVTRRALAPVADMARTAEEWSEHDLQRRFDLGTPDNEIRALGHTLDGLLDKVTQAILAEQRLTAELAHELRTPLTAALGTADLALMRDDVSDGARADLEDIVASCHAMSDIITSLLRLARAHAGSGTVTGGTSLADAVESARQTCADPSAVAVAVPVELRAAVPAELVGRMLAPLLDNALRLAGQVRVGAEGDERWVRLLVSDDGPGIDPDLARQVFTPGVSTGGGSGLGLALSRRIARTVGGDVRLLEPAATAGGPRAGEGGGARFEVSLPAAHVS